MRFQANKAYQSQLIKLKDQSWLDRQREAGRIAAQALKLLEQQIEQRTAFSLLELNQLAEDYIQQQGGQLTFKGYKGFPAGCCISVNTQLVHGIPSTYHCVEGDVVSFDLGVTIDGVIADTALTCIYGEPKSTEHPRLITLANQCLYNAIKTIRIGAPLGVIGNAIYKTAKNGSARVIEQYGGHGICRTDSGEGIPHAVPFVANRANPNEGIHIQSGLVLAIEPMLIPESGAITTVVEEDGWTVSTPNVIGVHVEHSIYVHQDRVEILTYRDNEAIFTSNTVSFQEN